MRLRNLSNNHLCRQNIVKQVIFYSSLLLIWQFLVILKIWPDYVFPSPINVAKTTIDGFKNLSFLIAIVTSLKRLLIGYGISIGLGLAFGILICKFRIVDDTFGNLVLGIQTLPSICWLPLALIWFGLNERAIIFVIVMGSLFSVTMATEAGIRGVPLLYILAGKNLGALNRRRLLFEIIVPAALPTLITGLKQGWSFAWRSLLAGELIFANLGLGYLLLMGRELNDLSQVVAVMFIIALVSIFIDRFIFGRIESNITNKWGSR